MCRLGRMISHGMRKYHEYHIWNRCMACCLSEFCGLSDMILLRKDTLVLELEV